MLTLLRTAYLVKARLLMDTVEQRQHIVRTITRLTVGTPLEATPYEQAMLEEFVQGSLTIDEVIDRLEQEEQRATAVKSE